MKVAIIGTHFVGKTTLCRNLSIQLQKDGKDVKKIPEIVRECPFPINEMATVQSQTWILNTQMKKEQELQNETDFLLCDRGSIDNFAYWLRVAKNHNLPEEVIEQTKQKVFDHTHSYDLILYLDPFNLNIKGDGFRSIDPTFRNEIHQFLQNLIQEYRETGHNSVYAISGSADELTQQALHLMNKKLISSA